MHWKVLVLYFSIISFCASTFLMNMKLINSCHTFQRLLPRPPTASSSSRTTCTRGLPPSCASPGTPWTWRRTSTPTFASPSSVIGNRQLGNYSCFASTAVSRKDRGMRRREAVLFFFFDQITCIVQCLYCQWLIYQNDGKPKKWTQNGVFFFFALWR